MIAKTAKPRVSKRPSRKLLAEVVRRIVEACEPESIVLFGSAARGEMTEHSDLDLLVNFEQGRSLFDLIGFEQELEDLLGCHVHVVTEGGLKSKRRETILSEATAIDGP